MPRKPKPVPPARITRLTAAPNDVRATCFGCHRKPRRHTDGAPLAVWIGVVGDAVCVCSVCLAAALIDLQFIEADAEQRLQRILAGLEVVAAVKEAGPTGKARRRN